MKPVKISRFVRASDLARAYAGFGSLELRPYTTGNTEAAKMHLELAQETPSDLQHLLVQYFSRITGNIVITGRIDGARFVGSKVVLVEYKTLAKNEIPDKLIEMATFQLQVYLWLLEKHTNLAEEHYVEFYNRETKRLIKRVTVKANSRIEPLIWLTVAKCYGEL